MNPCSHFHPLSSVTGLDSEGVCLTCGTAWGPEDVRAAVKRATSFVIVTCTLCGHDRKLTGDDVYVLTGKGGMVLVHDCDTCNNTIHTPLCPEAAARLVSAHVMFTTEIDPITDREIKAFEIGLGFDVMQVLEREMAS